MTIATADPARPLSRQALVRHRERALRRRKARIRRNRLFAGVLCSLAGFAGFTAFSVATGSARPQSDHVAVPVALTSLVLPTRVIPGSVTGMPWPKKGQSAVAVQGVGVMATSPHESSVPIASLTKMMTAYVVLTDHPIPLGTQGPMFTMTAADVAEYVHADQTDESNAPVQLNEHLTEYQLLEALLMPSADNIADLLAIWDAKSIARFVVKMNATAEALGLTSTHYADASGVNPLSRSTAHDQAILASALMENLDVRAIVAQPRVGFPVAGTIWNVNPGLGHDGIIGVKSGYTSHAQGCLATAAYETVGTKRALVVAVTLTQPDGLYGAANVDEALLSKTASTLIAYRPIPPGVPVAQATVPWSATTTVASLSTDVTVVGWPGLAIKERVVGAPARAAISSTGQLGEIEFAVNDAVVAKGRLVAVTPVPAAPSGWQP